MHSRKEQHSSRTVRCSGCRRRSSRRRTTGSPPARSDTTADELHNRLLGYPRIEVDEEIARRAGELLAEADDRAGANASVRANDGYIAAMADLLDDVVLTDNGDDFERLGVPVETY